MNRYSIPEGWKGRFVTAIPLRRIEGKYEILDKLREGGMGAIYKVRHRLLDEIRVIKLMRPQFVEDEELKTRFLREARLAIKLRHPNIAQLYDFTVDDDGTAFIVMEFIDGVTLEDLLTFHGPPPLGLALEIAQQSLKALGYLHLRGFVHRDISPDNLMLTGDTEGQPLLKLIDLGIAKTLDVGGESRLTQAGTFLGKLRYASPEQFGADGGTPVDGRGDLYSFGIVLYELLTGRFPIQGRDPSALIAGHLFRPPLGFAEADPAGRVPEGLRAVVLKTLAKAPDDRFATAAELSRALAAFRLPDDLPGDAMEAFRERPFLSAGSSALPDTGSTQHRLDQNFELATTPSPGSLLQLTKAAAAEAAAMPRPEMEGAMGPPPGLSAEGGKGGEPEIDGTAVELALAGIREALAARSYRAAESLLYAAEARFGTHQELAALYEQVAEERREDLVAKVKQRLESAHRLAAAKDFPAALAEVERARRIDPESPAVAAARTGIAASQGREAEIAGKLARTLVTARELASREDFKGALKELRHAARLDPASSEVSALLDETTVASRRQTENRRREQQLAREVRKVEERLDQGDLDGAQKLLDKRGPPGGAEAGDDPFAALRERLAGLRRAARRAAALAAAVDEIRGALDHEELDDAAKLLDVAVVRFGAADLLRQQWERLELAQRGRRQAREKLRTTEIEGLFEAAQEIADLLSRREAREALRSLNAAVARFGERSELAELRKLIATMLID